MRVKRPGSLKHKKIVTYLQDDRKQKLRRKLEVNPSLANVVYSKDKVK